MSDKTTDGPPTGFGLWITTPDGQMAETVARAGYDFVILDLQHGNLGQETALDLIRIFDIHAVPALVRVQANDPAFIMRALDIGARGVIVPMVETAEEASAAARATRYPPHGNRSFGPLRNYYSAAPDTAPPHLCFVMIETADALDNVEAIAATAHIDGLFMGPVDLALSLGATAVEALTISDRISNAANRIVAAGKKNGLITGSHALTLDHARDLARRGMQFVPTGSDVGLLRQAANTALSTVRRLR